MRITLIDKYMFFVVILLMWYDDDGGCCARPLIAVSERERSRSLIFLQYVRDCLLYDFFCVSSFVCLWNCLSFSLQLLLLLLERMCFFYLYMFCGRYYFQFNLFSLDIYIGPVHTSFVILPGFFFVWVLHETIYEICE